MERSPERVAEIKAELQASKEQLERQILQVADREAQHQVRSAPLLCALAVRGRGGNVVHIESLDLRCGSRGKGHLVRRLSALSVAICSSALLVCVR